MLVIKPSGKWKIWKITKFSLLFDLLKSYEYRYFVHNTHLVLLLVRNEKHFQEDIVEDSEIPVTIEQGNIFINPNFSINYKEIN